MSININNLVPDSKIFDSIKFTDKVNIAAEDKSQGSFLDVLKSKIDGVNDKQLNSESITEQFIKGDNVDVHEVMLAGEEAKMSLELAVQVRNKLIDAYQELSRTQM